MNKQVRFTTALALGAAVLSIPTLGYAQLTVEIGDRASFIAKGAGAIVSVDVTCEGGSVAPPNNTFVFVQLLQRAGKGLSSGGGSASNFNCSTDPTTVQVLVTPDSRPFKKAPAAARAFLDSCLPDFSACENAQDAEEIQLR